MIRPFFTDSTFCATNTVFCVSVFRPGHFVLAGVLSIGKRYLRVESQSTQFSAPVPRRGRNSRRSASKRGNRKPLSIFSMVEKKKTIERASLERPSPSLIRDCENRHSSRPDPSLALRDKYPAVNGETSDRAGDARVRLSERPALRRD
jgi:hypothetical protein